MRLLRNLTAALGVRPAAGAPQRQQSFLSDDICCHDVCYSAVKRSGGRRRIEFLPLSSTSLIQNGGASSSSCCSSGSSCKSSESFACMCRAPDSRYSLILSRWGTSSSSNLKNSSWNMGNTGSSSCCSILSSDTRSRSFNSSGSSMRLFSSSSTRRDNSSSGSGRLSSCVNRGFSSGSGSERFTVRRACDTSSSRLSSRSSSRLSTRSGSGSVGTNTFSAAAAPTDKRAAAAAACWFVERKKKAAICSAESSAWESFPRGDELLQQQQQQREDQKPRPRVAHALVAVLQRQQQPFCGVHVTRPLLTAALRPAAGVATTAAADGNCHRRAAAAAAAANRSAIVITRGAAAVAAATGGKSWAFSAAAYYYSSAAAAAGTWAAGTAGGARQQQQRGGDSKVGEEEQAAAAHRRFVEVHVKPTIERERAAIAGETGEERRPTFVAEERGEEEAAATRKSVEKTKAEREAAAAEKRRTTRMEELDLTGRAAAARGGKRAAAGAAAEGRGRLSVQQQQREEQEARAAYERHVQKVIESERAAEAHEIGEEARQSAETAAAAEAFSEEEATAAVAAGRRGTDDRGNFSARERSEEKSRSQRSAMKGQAESHMHASGARAGIEEQQQQGVEQKKQRGQRVAEEFLAFGQERSTQRKKNFTGSGSSRFFSSMLLHSPCSAAAVVGSTTSRTFTHDSAALNAAASAPPAVDTTTSAAALPCSSSASYSSSPASFSHALSSERETAEPQAGGAAGDGRVPPAAAGAAAGGAGPAAAAAGPAATAAGRAAAAVEAAADEKKAEPVHVTVGPRPVYLDYQSTTVLDPRVTDAMLPFMYDLFGNPHSSSHALGWEANAAVEKARHQVAALLGIEDPGRAREIIFTSGATESNNLAIKGAVRYYCRRGNPVRFNKNSARRAASNKEGGAGRGRAAAAAAAALAAGGRGEEAKKGRRGGSSSNEGEVDKEKKKKEEEEEEIWYRPRERNHIITTQLEHKCALQCCRLLQVQHRESGGTAGCDVTFLPVDREGLVDVEILEKAIRPSTLLVSVMHVNNEIGVMQNLKAIGEVCAKKDVLFHTDAAQSVGKVPVNVDEMKVDMLSLSGHKIYGPKGVGALFLRSKKPRVRLLPLIDGGGQERGLRSGTLPTALCVGLGAACDVARKEMKNDERHIKYLAKLLLESVKEKIPFVEVNGSVTQRYVGNWNISFTFVEGESLIMSFRNVAVSSGSACTSASLEPSYVLRALGVGEEVAHTSLRFGLGRFTTVKDVEMCVDTLAREVKRLRDMSPLYEFEMVKRQAQASGLCPNDETDSAATLVWT